MVIHSEHFSEVDCTREDVRVQARWELNRAETEGPEGMATWAEKWGRALLTAADGLSNEAGEARELRQQHEADQEALAEADERHAEMKKVIRSAIETLEAA